MTKLFLVLGVFVVGMVLVSRMAQSQVVGSGAKSPSTTPVASLLSERPPVDQPVEIGHVRWGRDLDAALAASKQSGKPVLLLFQEIPGCAGCQRFGREVLTQPLLVEAIESEFVPVVAYNNRSTGIDKELLVRFKEPAWNYQVMRFLNADGKDIVPRRDRVWTLSAVVERLIEVLQTAKRPVPKYLQTVAAAEQQSEHAQAAFAMYCFWTGEQKLGKIDGVVSTEAGWFDGREVTLVYYDKKKLPLEKLATEAARVRCADKVYTAEGANLAGLSGGKLDASYRPASASDQKKQVSRLKGLAKTPGINAMQMTKFNSLAVENMATALQWLSPRQREYLEKTLR